MPVKFKESSKILVNRAANKHKTVHYYLRNTSTSDILEAYQKENTKPKLRQKYKNELVARGAI